MLNLPLWAVQANRANDFYRPEAVQVLTSRTFEIIQEQRYLRRISADQDRHSTENGFFQTDICEEPCQAIGIDKSVSWLSDCRKGDSVMSVETQTSTTPEQTFFDDPAVDRVLGVVMALATEVYVLKDRLRTAERVLEKEGHLDRSLLDREPSPEDLAKDAADREAFVAGLMENLRGVQVSKGAAGTGGRHG
jgi:hypothetical protein